MLVDDDGVLLLPADRVEELAAVATRIRDTERRQAARMQLGRSLREQTRFADYLVARERDGVTFHRHLRSLDAAMEE